MPGMKPVIAPQAAATTMPTDAASTGSAGMYARRTSALSRRGREADASHHKPARNLSKTNPLVASKMKIEKLTSG